MIFGKLVFTPANVFYVSKKWLDINEKILELVSRMMPFHNVYHTMSKNLIILIVSSSILTIHFTKLYILEQHQLKKVQMKNIIELKAKYRTGTSFFSTRMQQIAKERAMKIVSNLLIQDLGSNYIMENILKKYILIYPLPKSVLSKDNIIKLNYKVSKVQLEIKKILRIFYFLNYTGGSFYKNRKELII